MPRNPVRSALHVSACVEIARRLKPAPAVLVILSIPGREGTLERTWETPEGRLTESQLADLEGWVLLSIQNALARETGIQQTLHL